MTSRLHLSRRVLAALGLATTAALALSACGSDAAAPAASTPTSAPSSSAPSSGAPSAGSSSSDGSESAGGTSAAGSSDGSTTSSSTTSSSTTSGSSTSAVTTGASTPADGTFPVTIKNIYGETTIEQAPTRVATITWVNPDIALALGVAPVGMDKDIYGQNANNSTDWKDEALAKLGASIGGDNAPAQFDITNGINFDAIADTTPDVILAAYSGLSQDEYDKLSQIAPVVGPLDAGYTTSWQDATVAIGAALGRSTTAAELVSTVEKQISDARAANPILSKTTFIAANLDPTQNVVSLYTGGDTRPRFFESLGLTQAPIVDKGAKSGEFYYDIAKERANELDSDIIYSAVTPGVTLAKLQADALLGQIPAVKSGATVLIEDEQLVLSVSAASPLSLQWALPKYIPLIVEAAQTAAEAS